MCAVLFLNNEHSVFKPSMILLAHFFIFLINYSSGEAHIAKQEFRLRRVLFGKVIAHLLKTKVCLFKGHRFTKSIPEVEDITNTQPLIFTRGCTLNEQLIVDATLNA